MTDEFLSPATLNVATKIANDVQPFIAGKPANAVIMAAGLLLGQIEAQRPRPRDSGALDAMMAMVRATAIHHANTLREPQPAPQASVMAHEFFTPERMREAQLLANEMQVAYGGRDSYTIIMAIALIMGQLDSQMPEPHDPNELGRWLALIRSTAVQYSADLRKEKMLKTAN
ncbi:MAG: hypothetical protein QOF32_1619 [Gammaproteobacteria bacterium]|jgi:hypothetical protein|nr:hypothetical protein [Gammaproteobacteria bacterium]